MQRPDPRDSSHSASHGRRSDKVYIPQQSERWHDHTAKIVGGATMAVVLIVGCVLYSWIRRDTKRRREQQRLQEQRDFEELQRDKAERAEEAKQKAELQKELAMLGPPSLGMPGMPPSSAGGPWLPPMPLMGYMHSQQPSTMNLAPARSPFEMDMHTASMPSPGARGAHLGFGMPPASSGVDMMGVPPHSEPSPWGVHRGMHPTPHWGLPMSMGHPSPYR